MPTVAAPNGNWCLQVPLLRQPQGTATVNVAYKTDDVGEGNVHPERKNDILLENVRLFEYLYSNEI